MTQISAAFTAYDAQANREDLSNVIYNIDPYDTPCMSMFGRRNVTNRLFDWQTENLPAVDKSNADFEGFELTRAESTPTVRLQNSTQISHRDATVSGSQDAHDAAGKRKELAHQLALSSKALKRDVESIICGEQPLDLGSGDTSVGAGDATPRNTRGMEHWISTNVDSGAGYANPVDAVSPITDGTPRAFIEDMIGDSMQAAYDLGAEPSVLLVGSFNKRIVSTFVGRANSRHAVSANTASNNVTLYMSDFGDLRVMTSRWIRQQTAFLLDATYWAVGFFRGFQRSRLAKIGDATTEMILAEYGVEARNEASSAKIADLLTS